MNSLALPTTVADIIDEYNFKVDRVDLAIESINRAFTDLDMATTVHGTFIDQISKKPYLHESTLKTNLLKSGWKAVYNRLQIDSIASAKDKKLFEQAMANPPPLTMETAKATFGDYLIRPRFHALRGLAEVFCSLDQSYKSHSKVKIGVDGLPKRVIMAGWGGYSSWGTDRFRDLANALAAVRNQPQMDYAEIRQIEKFHNAGEDAVLDGKPYIKYIDGKDIEVPGVDRGITVRKFKNGNAHIIFDNGALFDINKALAEFYGEVLPDVEPENVKPSASTTVAKDLQFYWTPKHVVDLALDYASVWSDQQYSGKRPNLYILEPSCGDGRILEGIRERGYESLGIEYHPERVAESRKKGFAVLSANFLEHPEQPIFDRVVMNPPFYGRHYIKHVEHGKKFLKPNGILVAILPATARYDHGELQGSWQDLPVASFSEVGTNVPTVLYRYSA